jgi:LmbE family N-acetylglucosaminyl deacetylase
MATLVCFHAHPDDEAIGTGGLMAAAADAGHDVVLVVATRGELGEPVPGVLGEGEALWERRVVETHRSAEILGAGRVEFLGYEDSGMMGEDTNDNPACFWQADVEEAAAKLAGLLEEVGADVLTIYDDHGGYGHPDHIQVHRVGRRAAELAGVRRVFEGTMNRDHIRRLMAMRAELEGTGTEDGNLQDGRDDLDVSEEGSFGTPEHLITHAVDVSAYVPRKREAMQAHASQIGEESFFLTMPPEAFAAAFGTEWFISPGLARAAGEPMATSLLDEVEEPARP